MGHFRLKTIRGYDFFAASSSLQKAIRRNDAKIAGYFGIELWESNFKEYVWKRILTISAEDCYGIITKEILSLYEAYKIINKGKGDEKGRIFLSKAIIILCNQEKSRDADHLTNLVYDKKIGITDEELENFMNESRKNQIDPPEYAFDVHTQKGKAQGKTKDDFFIEEFESLKPRQPGLFDNLIEIVKNNQIALN